MTKTPEELTKEWLNNKLQAGSFWFVETEDSNPEPMVVDMDGDLNDYEGNYYRPCFSKGKLKVLAPCNYDEYKAMQAELAEHRRYCCCEENEVMRLKLAEMEELLKECKKYIDFCCVPDGFGKSYIAEELLARINAAIDESEKR